jgi:hypothetical protein
MKSVIISGVAGLAFLGGGFFAGMKLSPLPKVPAKTSAPAATVAAPTAIADPITPESLKKTSEELTDLNKNLQQREHDVAVREQAVKQREDEMDAERDALNRSHQKFNQLYGEFQQRLQLVESNEIDQLKRQDDLYTTMDVASAVDLVRGRDDSAVTRLFSVMEVKELAKFVAQWKTKYPDDAARLLRLLDGMGRVVPKDEMAMPDAAVPTSDTGVVAPPATLPDASTPSAASSPAPDAAGPVSDPNAAPAADPGAAAPNSLSSPAEASTNAPPPADAVSAAPSAAPAN